MSKREDWPLVLFIGDVAELLRCSPSTIKRRLRARTFPVLPLPGIDKRLRWSRESIERYLHGIDPPMTSRGRRKRSRKSPGD